MDILELLELHAELYPEKLAYGYLGAEHELSGELTYKSLWLKVGRASQQLSSKYSTGSRVVILLPADPSFIISFLGAIHAGLIAVPCPVGYSESGINRILKIAEDCEAAGIISNRKTLKMLFQRKSVPSTELQKRAESVLFAEDFEMEFFDKEVFTRTLVAGQPAYLQYTSGSTNLPKGVMVSHENLTANLNAINTWFGRQASDISVTWLPHYHDMGLVDGLLSPLYTGGTALVVAPLLFITKPLVYLRAISDYKAGFTGGPGFALDHCVSRIPAEQLQGIDLSTLKVWYVGAEPLRLTGLQKFTGAMHPLGLRPESVVPAYGLAEATLAVSLHDPKRILDYQADLENRFKHVVACGPPVEKTEVRIVNPDTKEIAHPFEKGEIWVKSPGVAMGYWNNDCATTETFLAYTSCGKGPFLRTGDLGFISEGQIYITGRRKELIIIRGVNYYPQDIEEVVSESHEDILLNATAAFSVETVQGEALMIVSELRRSSRDNEAMEHIKTKIAHNIGFAFGLVPHEIKLIQAGKLPKTSSGKIQRLKARELFSLN